MKKRSIPIDISVCLLMAIGMYVVFPLGRWIDHIPINTMLLLGFYYLCFIVNRTATIPLFLKGGRWPLLAVLILTASVLLMAALTYCHEGWPFYRLADPGKVSLGQQRAWLFFLIVQVTSCTIGIINELARQRIRQQTTINDCDSLRQALAIEETRLQELAELLISSDPWTISVKSERKNVLVPLSDILYIESMGNYVFLNLKGGQQLKSLTTMTDLMAQLPANEFVRIHKSYVVALSHIVSFNSRQVSVEGTILPIGRTYTEAIRQQLAQKAGNV